MLHFGLETGIRPLGRSPKELLDTVDDLKARDDNLISLKKQIATTSASGELAFHVFGAIAHFERRLISERTKDGLATARNPKRNPGRPSLQQETVSAVSQAASSLVSANQQLTGLSETWLSDPCSSFVPT